MPQSPSKCSHAHLHSQAPRFTPICAPSSSAPHRQVRQRARTMHLRSARTRQGRESCCPRVGSTGAMPQSLRALRARQRRACGALDTPSPRHDAPVTNACSTVCSSSAAAAAEERKERREAGRSWSLLYIMPGMPPPIPAIAAGSIGASFSFTSVISAEVVMTDAAIEAELSTACCVTVAGSMTPVSRRFS